MSELRDQHKAFAEWFLQQNPVAPNAEDLAWAAWKAALAQPETKAEPMAWAVMCDGANCTQICLTETAANLIAENMREHNRGRDFDWQTIPLYAHPPRDEWRPASEPPEDDRSVLVWMPGKLGGLAIGRCSRGNWSPYFLGSPVTQWRDIEPPEQEGGR